MENDGGQDQIGWLSSLSNCCHVSAVFFFHSLLSSSVLVPVQDAKTRILFSDGRVVFIMQVLQGLPK